jgi:5-methylcytosine-specific restriction endonuclease McrA
MLRKCEFCDAEFQCPPSHVARGAGKFCSRQCHGAHRTKTAAENPHERTRKPRPSGVRYVGDRVKLLERKRRYHERHVEQDRERNARWREANKEHVAAKNKAYREQHPEAARKGNLRWREAHPELYAAAQRANACNRRAKAAGVLGRIKGADIAALWERQPVCVKCGKGRGVDHIIELSRGGPNTTDNLQNLCRTCNALKQAKLTMDDARSIRAAHSAGETRASIARRYGVSSGNVWLIVVGGTWQESGAQ